MGRGMSSRVFVVLFMVDVVVNVAIQLFFLQIQMRCFVLYGRSGCHMLVIFKVFVMLFNMLWLSVRCFNRIMVYIIVMCSDTMGRAGQADRNEKSCSGFSE